MASRTPARPHPFLDEVDREAIEAERNASPTPSPGPDPSPAPTPPPAPRRPSDEIERVSTTASSATTSSHQPRDAGVRAAAGTGTGPDADQLSYRATSMSRVPTHLEPLDRYPTDLVRIATQRSQHSETVGRRVSTRRSRFSRRSENPCLRLAAARSTPMLPERDEYVVEFDGEDDPLHPHNWPFKKKLYTAAILGYTTLAAVFASSLFTPAVSQISEAYHVGTTLKGRRLPIILSMFGFTLFSIATGTAENLQTIIICRFFSGLFGAGPIAVVAAVFSDMFDNRTRGIAITIFSMTLALDRLPPRHHGRRRLPPRHHFTRGDVPPAILVGKASELRRRTRNWGIHAKQEEIEVDLRELISKNFSRPLRLLFGEPIVLLLTIYTAFIYGLLYLFMTSYPAVYQRVHGFSRARPASLPRHDLASPTVAIGGVAFTIGIFWFGWTGYNPKIHWIVPTLSGIFTGFGLLSIFLQAINYLVDAYLMFQHLPPLLAGAAFPLFANQMFTGLGVQWAATLLGCVAAVLVPIPIVFYIYGARLRERSAFAPVMQPHADPHSAEDEEEVNKEANGASSAIGEKRNSLSAASVQGRGPQNGAAARGANMV
ncbi:unnamed protein product [Parascedosporium putredinis]|uniref:Major facilitator superfamily (MFS) profile domain-containing protein n=1 Tax=Parascedosporium putredinis TaxID=1442378 RepID=A0A9P1H8U5_9PEZI|nr:unnamed protein product [Parascedosporium putredinis]CAI7999675.1 unnamed protein product [Parascedosporium putredinis]